MAQNVSNIMFFKENQVCKIPPRGGGTNVFLARGLLLKMIENTLLNVLILELKIYCGPDKFYGRSKFGQYDEVKNRAPLYSPRKDFHYLPYILCI